MCENDKQVWNSLDKAKLATSATVPFLILCFGFWFGSIESNRENQSRVADLRFEKYEKLGMELNNIYAYLLYVGNWKETTPVDVLQSKRNADTMFYTFNSLYSKDFKNNYNLFMSEAFKIRNGWGLDAKIRSGFRNRKDIKSFLLESRKGQLESVEWNNEWDILFTGETNPEDQTRIVAIDSSDRLNHGKVTERGKKLKVIYRKLNNQIAKELKLN